MRLPIAGLFCFVLVLNACRQEKRQVEEGCDFTFRVEEDGLGSAFAAPIFLAIDESARISRRPMSVEFLRGGNSWIFLMGRKEYYRSSSLISIDLRHLSIGTFAIEVDGIQVSDSELRERAQQYGAALRKTDSRGIWKVSTNSTVSLSRVLEYLVVLHDSGVSSIELEAAPQSRVADS